MAIVEIDDSERILDTPLGKIEILVDGEPIDYEVKTETLQKELENEELSFEQRKEIIDQMVEITKMMGVKDTENKKFIVKMAMCATAALSVSALALASALGSNSAIGSDEISGDNNDFR